MTTLADTQKHCSKCDTPKPRAEFNKNRSRRDGLQAYCKPCKRAWREANPGKQREYSRTWREANPEKAREIARKERAANPEKAREIARKSDAKRRATTEGRWKHRAKNAVNHAIRAGRLARPDACERCNEPCTPHGHHWNYARSRWLDVIWLCRLCHAAEHAERRKIAAELERLTA